MSRKLKIVIFTILTVVLLITTISIFTKIKNDDTKTLHLSFERGSLGTNGEYVETKESIYTKESFYCKGLKIKTDFESQVSYRLYFYDRLDNFISCTELLTDDYTSDSTLPKVKARIVITPLYDDKVGLFEIMTYRNDIKVEVSKNNYDDIFENDLSKYTNIYKNYTFSADELETLDNTCFVANNGTTVYKIRVNSFDSVFAELSNSLNSVSFIYYTDIHDNIVDKKMINPGLLYFNQAINDNAYYMYFVLESHININIFGYKN